MRVMTRSSTGPVDLAVLPRVGLDAVVFVSSFYDGPLAGLLIFAGRLHFFALAPQAETLDGPLLVYPLTEDEAARELRCKRLFERHVGTWWSYDVPAEQRGFADCGGFERYTQAVTAEFGAVNEADVEAGYQRRDPVAVLDCD